MAGLTPKQQRFVEEYLRDLNASAAVRRAGYKVRRPDQQGYELLRKPEIAAAISAQRDKLAERTQRTIDDAMADIRRRGALAEQAGDFGPAIKAAELEAKHLGAFEEHNRQKNPLGTFDPGRFFGELFRRPDQPEDPA